MEGKVKSIAPSDVPASAPKTCQRCNANKISARVAAYNLEMEWWCKECVQDRLELEKLLEQEVDVRKEAKATRVERDVWTIFDPSPAEQLSKAAVGLANKHKHLLDDFSEQIELSDEAKSYCRASPQRSVIYKVKDEEGETVLVLYNPIAVFKDKEGKKFSYDNVFKAIKHLESKNKAQLRFIVVPSGHPHHLHPIAEYAKQYPNATIFLPSGRAEREMPELQKMESVAFMPDEGGIPAPELRMLGFEVCLVEGLTEQPLPGRGDSKKVKCGTGEHAILFHPPTKSICLADFVLLWHPNHRVDTHARCVFRGGRVHRGKMAVNHLGAAIYDRKKIAESAEFVLTWNFDTLFDIHGGRECMVRFNGKAMFRDAIRDTMLDIWQNMPLRMLDIPQNLKLDGGWEKYQQISDKEAEKAHGEGDVDQKLLDEMSSLNIATTPRNQAKNGLPPVPKKRREGDDNRGVSSLQGKRPYMEDRDDFKDDLLEVAAEIGNNAALGIEAKAAADADWFATLSQRAWYAGVFDGHSGQLAADYLKKNLSKFVATELANAGKDAELDKKTLGEVDGDAVSAALFRAFRNCDADMQLLAEQNEWVDGSTCVIAVGLGSKIYIANSGDSECVLGRKNGDEYEAVELSKKWKPTDKEEKDRIVGAGGLVIFGRVNGEVAVSRGFGDRLFKTPASNTTADLISVDPHVRCWERTDEDEFLIIACDGLWDVFSYKEAVDFAVQKRKSGIGAAHIAEELCEAALAKGSGDNITTLVWFLKK